MIYRDCTMCGRSTWRRKPKQYCKRCFQSEVSAGRLRCKTGDPWYPKPQRPPRVPAALRPPDPNKLALRALTALEAALKAKLDSPGAAITDEAREAFRMYQLYKTRALNPGSPNEGVIAMRRALAGAAESAKLVWF